jgi:predicted secreted hydrolase
VSRAARAGQGSAVALGMALALAAAAAVSAAPGDGWRAVRAPWRFAFPRDHASHPEFRTEWWYYTGHLEAEGRAFGYQLTFFRVGLDRARASSPSAWAPHTLFFAHAALTDERGRRFLTDTRLDRPALGLAGADTATYRVWVDDWSAALARDGLTHVLRARIGDATLALDATPLGPPVLHGRDGVSVKSADGGASHYYSLTRLRTRGRLTLGGDTLRVSGSSWMDHEFMSTSLSPGQVGWDWFAIGLDDGRDLMLYRLRRADGSDEPASSGTLVARDGGTRHLPRAAWSVSAARVWTSPRSGGRYPAEWTVRVPGEGLELRLTPVLDDQEVDDTGTGIAYWEGAVRVEGTARGRVVRGRGYVELTGYAGAPPGPPSDDAPGSPRP